MTIAVTFTFTGDDQYILSRVNEMSGVRGTIEEAGRMSAVVLPPFDATRLDNVENVILGLAPDAVRLPDPTPAASGQE